MTEAMTERQAARVERLKTRQEWRREETAA